MTKGPYYLQQEYPMSQRAHYLCFYLTDGTIEEFVLDDPRIPLPRFLSLITTEQPNDRT